jgi:hypothetical protein
MIVSSTSATKTVTRTMPGIGPPCVEDNAFEVDYVAGPQRADTRYSILDAG